MLEAMAEPSPEGERALDRHRALSWRGAVKESIGKLGGRSPEPSEGAWGGVRGPGPGGGRATS